MSMNAPVTTRLWYYPRFTSCLEPVGMFTPGREHGSVDSCLDSRAALNFQRSDAVQIAGHRTKQSLSKGCGCHVAGSRGILHQLHEEAGGMQLRHEPLLRQLTQDETVALNRRNTDRPRRAR